MSAQLPDLHNSFSESNAIANRQHVQINDTVNGVILSLIRFGTINLSKLWLKDSFPQKCKPVQPGILT